MLHLTPALTRAGLMILLALALTSALTPCLAARSGGQPEIAPASGTQTPAIALAPFAAVAATAMPTAPHAPTPPETSMRTPTSDVTTYGHLTLSDHADQDAYVLIQDGEALMHGSTEDLARARRLAGSTGALLWFRNGGKSYVVRDAATLQRIRVLYAPVSQLGEAQGALGERQGRLGEQQAALGMQMAAVAERDAAAAVAQTRASLARDTAAARPATSTTQQANAARQRSTQQQIEALATQQQALAAQQADLATQQAAASARADGQARHAMREAIRNGLASPVTR
ncbi:hypothetical protein VC273_00830 [Xanthomonas nasturtii]|uniref:hypothetical protein n=1 Tax=Xanthomonas TaxID=338 RepID=UPI002B22CC53|nr:hypothetical protein [Xanthomonas nasturtii]MEA9554517.1 hypothetical protein [Xanthomonas nasturtii]